MQKKNLHHDAIGFFSQAIVINENCDVAYYGRAQSLLQNGFVEKAIVDLKRTIEIQPFAPHAYYRLAHAYAKMNNLDKSKQFLISCVMSFFLVAEYENLYVDYYWNNSFKFKYKNIFTAKNITIKEIIDLKTWPTNNFESSRHWREYISSQPISNYENVSLDITNPKIELEHMHFFVSIADKILRV